ncbi:hypothetical protein [Fibrella forsythiae]|uniref:Adhesin domain-containing protein n=1 Tax=Fibrella forsythiae TaxID=2817061 RepID=A0ABS3JII6_9BACT|nr:hypothetical protein [Fibrella forsythiae]MBO0948677.1 hypothetical protein [Fibrella forsythiae]
MNPFNPYLVFLAACLLAVRALAQAPDDQPAAVAQHTPQPAAQFAPMAQLELQELADDRTEYTRTILKSLPVDSKATLSIDNRFGDVSVSLWDRNEFRVNIVITSSSKDANRAKQALNAVQIDERRDGNAYIFKTMIDSEFEKNQEKNEDGGTITSSRGEERTYPNGLKTSWKASRKESNTSLQITYRISMPKANGLTINNSFGNTIIPDFWAPLSVSSRFGDVTGATLNNASTKIKASFGNVSIRDVQNGNVVMSFGDVDINSGNVLSIQQTYGKLNIGETNKVDVRTSYTDALIGAVRQSGKFKMNYAKQFRVERIGASADKIDVEATYSSVALPMQSTPNCDFDVTVTHGGFTYPTLPNLQLLTQPTTPAPPRMPTGITVTSPPRPARVRQYVGKVGNGDGPSIKVVATYGDVRFNK